ncbi:MAG: alanine racemase [Candidatus Paceibacterota bacterium]
MINFLTWLSRKRFPYEPLITVEISKSRLIHNLNEFKKIAPCGVIAPVLKSNAYGHGLLEIASILEKYSVHEKLKTIPFFIVDSYFEAVVMRSHGIKTHLLIIGYTRSETIQDSKLHNVSYTISSLEQLQQIKEIKKPISIHLKIDTGMHRQGLLEEEIKEAIDIISHNTSLVLKGLCSHLCDSDNHDFSFTEGQIHIWNRIAEYFKKEFTTLEYLHLSATDGHRFTHDIDANISRLGIGLYGLTTGNAFTPNLDLRPVMEVKTIITGVKKLQISKTVGYNNTFKAEHEMTIATIPVGYFEGIDRRLSNIGIIEVGQDKTPCPIIGRVSMNITSIDISNVIDVKIGTPVVVISNNPLHKNSIQSMASLAKTISYEIAVHIPAHLKRVIV